MHTFQPCPVSAVPFPPIASQLDHPQELLHMYTYIYIYKYTNHLLKMYVSTKLKSL